MQDKCDFLSIWEGCMMGDWQIDRNCTVANLDWIWAVFCDEFQLTLNACELDCLKSGPRGPGPDTKGPGLGPDAADLDPES